MENSIPLSADLSASDTPLARDLRSLLSDYTTLLPRTRVFTWPNDPANNDFTLRSWSGHERSFQMACQAAPAQCVPLLNGQLKVMNEAFRTVRDRPATRFDASLVSALADLCATSRYVDQELAAYRHCGGMTPYWGIAAVWWLDLGYDELFLRYLDQYQAHRRMTLGIWEQQGHPVRELLASGELPEIPPRIQARWFEAQDQLDAAGSAWLSILTSALAKGETESMLGPVQELARLSWQLADTRQAERWMDLARKLANRPDGAGKGCRESVASQRAEVARSRAVDVTGRPGPLEAIQEGCDSSAPIIEYAMGRLQTGETTGLAARLRAALNHCGTGGCAPGRVDRLGQLLAISEGDEAALMGQAQHWLAEFRKGGNWSHRDLQTVWALAISMARHPGLQANRLDLLDELMEYLQQRRQSTLLPSRGAQLNLSRYDALTRAHLVLAVQAGRTPDIARVESLRAQTLLRRLRLARWARDLDGVNDATIQAEFETESSRIRSMRDRLLDPAARASWNDQAVAVADALLANVDELLQMQEYRRLERLAESRARKKDTDLPPAWLDPTGAFGRIATQESRQAGLTSQTRLLNPREAYLTWLRVPGGYVALLARYDPEYQPRDWLSGPGHRVQSFFVPVSPAQEDALGLYRELLQSGAGAARGLKPKQAPPQTQAGLVWKGQPVWRLPDGSFQIAAKPPLGAVRVSNLKDIAQSISEWFLAPFAGHLEHARLLIVSPDGPLSYLPFETLSLAGKPILERLDIAYVQSLDVYQELQRKNWHDRSSQPGLFSLADPDYASPGKPAAIPEPLARAGEEVPPDLSWPSLPGTRQESQALSALFTPQTTLLGKQASRAQLDTRQRDRGLRPFRVLHFASHGYVDDARSALVLAMNDGPRQAYLWDSEVATLDLDSDLALLSACNTGVGRNVSGEGVVGLPYAFLLAGNRNTLMSLWPVDDAGTASFIPAFMTKARAGMDLVSALNETKREFASGKHGKRLADPRIWAAFVQYGVPRGLKEAANDPLRVTTRDLHDLARLYQAEGRLDLAETHHQRALSVREEKLGKDDPDTLASLEGLASVYLAKGEGYRATPLMERLLASLEAEKGLMHDETARARALLAAAYEAGLLENMAVALYEKALEQLEKERGWGHPDTLRAASLLLDIYDRMAKVNLEKGLSWLADPLMDKAHALRQRSAARPASSVRPHH